MKKKTSLREKGNRYQIWIRDYLLERGWTVHNLPITSRALYVPDKHNPGEKKIVWLPKDNDVFGCDLIARKGFDILWIQASLDPHITKRAEAFNLYFEEIGQNEYLMLWIKKEKGTWIKRFYIERNRGQEILGVMDFGTIIKREFKGSVEISHYFFGDKIDE